MRMSEPLTDGLEARAEDALCKLFEPLAVSLVRDYHRKWSVVLGRDARFVGGLTLTRRKDTLHDAVSAVCRLLRTVGRRRLVSQLVASTGGSPIELFEAWYQRPTQVRS